MFRHFPQSPVYNIHLRVQLQLSNILSIFLITLMSLYLIMYPYYEHIWHSKLTWQKKIYRGK